MGKQSRSHSSKVPFRGPWPTTEVAHETLGARIISTLLPVKLFSERIGLAFVCYKSQFSYFTPYTILVVGGRRGCALLFVLQCSWDLFVPPQGEHL